MSNLRANFQDQKYSLAITIQQINQSILECLIFKNYSSIPELVDLLETNLYPYFDKQYKDDLTKISKTGVLKGRTQAEITANAASISNQRMILKHRALMKLAHRNRFMPTSSHGEDMHMMED